MYLNEGIKTTRQTGPNRRLSLLRAALDLFSTQGYAGTTTKAIAECSGVTEALLFRHFHSKEELLREVVAQFSPRPLFQPPPDGISTLLPRAALELLITRYLDAVWANRVFIQMVFTTPKREQAVFEEIWAEFGRQGLTLYMALQERSDRGELKAGVAAMATDVISTATSGFLQRVLFEAPLDWEAARSAYVSSLLEVLFHGIA